MFLVLISQEFANAEALSDAIMSSLAKTGAVLWRRTRAMRV